MPPGSDCIGIDLGGTRLRGGLVSSTGQLAARIEVNTHAAQGPAHVLGNLKNVISELLQTAGTGRVAGIGIATAGQIHRDTQAVVYAPNLRWENVPLGDEIRSAFGLPTLIENDVRAAAWGEYRHGAGRGAGSLVAVFVGTGIGSGAVVDGLLIKGFNNVAGEFGHTRVVDDGVPCGCGQHGCVEAYASGSGLARRLQAALRDDVPTRLLAETGGDPARLTAIQVADAAAAGDALARALWSDALRYLGMALANYVTILDPEVLILGGGIIETVPGLSEALAERVARHAVLMARGVRVARAALGDSAGLVGAADRVRDHA